MVEDEDYQLRYVIVAGIDVAKGSAGSCGYGFLRRRGRTGRRNCRRCRPKTDKEDAGQIARLTDMGMLRLSFVPPPEIRARRVYTLRIWDLTADHIGHEDVPLSCGQSAAPHR